MAEVLRALVAGLLLAVVGFWAGCGGKSAGQVPVDSPIMEFEPPDAEELVDEDEAESEGNDEDGAEGDWTDDVDLEDNSRAGAVEDESKGKRPGVKPGGKKSSAIRPER